MDYKKFINSFDGVFEGIAASNWLLSIGVAVLSFTVIHGVLVLCRCRLKKIQSNEHGGRPVAELLSGTLAKTSNVVVVVTALLIGLTVLDLPQPWADRVKHLWFVTLGLQIGFWLNQLITISTTRYFKRHGESEAQPTVARTLMGWGMKTVLWVVLLLAMLSNLGINISAFVASLGIGGVAVALAVQNILGDLFASLSIAVDKPFEVGDAISVNGFSGSVEHVGLKTTRIRADSGEQIVIANADLLKNTVRNFKRMQNRRVQFSLNLNPATPVSVAEGIPAALRRVVEQQDTVRFERAHLKNVTQEALEFEVVYFVLNPSYGVFMDTQQRVLLATMKLVDEVGASVSRASQRVLVDSADDDKEDRSFRTLRYLKK